MNEQAMKLAPGNGILVRYPGLVLLFDVTDDELTAELLAAAGTAAEQDQPGRRLGESLIRLLATAEGKLPGLCAYGSVEGGVAVLVHGPATLTIRTEADEMRLDGRDAVTLVDKVVPDPVSSLQAVLGEAGADADTWSALGTGVVRADAFWVGGPTVAEPSAEEPAVAEETPPGPPGVSGVRCRKGHFNDPSLSYCGICGIGLTQAGKAPAHSERPSLGVLMLDDGTSFALDKEFLLGRAPEQAEEVRSGTATALKLHDPAVCDVHARISLDGWEVGVTDVDSVNGTYLRAPGTGTWVRLPSGVRSVLRPGAVVAVGGRQFRYDTYRKS
ncbi:FHA domain-containing protein [Amycolatopsis sp. NPDC058340]|uniref:FHA domain-containing protein n=1 Tax=Amycolatopsis sp. NPDC058340 TaxID=3346453 RepID=UPI00364DCC93